MFSGNYHNKKAPAPQNDGQTGKMLLAWMKQQRLFLASALIFMGVFGAVFFLYELPSGAFLYGALVCGFLLLIATAASFFRFVQRGKGLRAYRKTGGSTALPPAPGWVEGEYQAIINELQQQQKAMASKMQTDRLQDADYYGMWVHQMKVPLASLRLMMQSAESDDLPLPLRRDIRQQLFAIEQYTNMVLQYQRLQEGGTDLAFTSWPYDTLVHTGAKRVAPLFIAGNVSLQVERLPGAVVTDEKWFVFILEQLLSNAAKYTKNGRVRVYLKSQAELCVEDTGIGIRKADIPRLFERNYTGGETHGERYSTGIGLYLCARAAALLNLELSVESTLGKGTRVTIRHRQKGETIE